MHVSVSMHESFQICMCAGLWAYGENVGKVYVCIYAFLHCPLCRFVCLRGHGVGEGLNHESEEHLNLCAYLIKDKFIHVHLLKGVVLSGVGACDSSQSRCEPPPQSKASPKRLEVPEEEMVQ